MKDRESDLYNSSEDYGSDRKYRDDDEDDDDLSYVETGRSSGVLNIRDPVQHGTLPADVISFNYDVSDDSDEEDYMALRRLVLYGKIVFLSLVFI